MGTLHQLKLRFDLGEVIFHKKYGYRGLIVEFDLTCQAPDEWYYSTNPTRPQPTLVPHISG